MPRSKQKQQRANSKERSDRDGFAPADYVPNTIGNADATEMVNSDEEEKDNENLHISQRERAEAQSEMQRHLNLIQNAQQEQPPQQHNNPFAVNAPRANRVMQLDEFLGHASSKR